MYSIFLFLTLYKIMFVRVKIKIELHWIELSLITHYLSQHALCSSIWLAWSLFLFICKTGKGKRTGVFIHYLCVEVKIWISRELVDRFVEVRLIPLGCLIFRTGIFSLLGVAGNDGRQDAVIQRNKGVHSEKYLKTTKKCLHSHFVLWNSLHVQQGRLVSFPMNTSLDLPFLALTVNASTTVDDGMACSDEFSAASLTFMQWSIKGCGRSCR